MKTVKLAALAALILPATAMVAVAAAPGAVIQKRQENFKAMGKAMKAISDEFKLPSPNPAVIKANANTLAAAAAKVKGHFPKGTGPESGVKTDALPVIWQKQAEFKAADAKAVAATKALVAAANSGDLARMQAAVGPVGGTCKGCHDTFRKPRG